MRGTVTRRSEGFNFYKHMNKIEAHVPADSSPPTSPTPRKMLLEQFIGFILQFVMVYMMILFIMLLL